MYRNGSPWAQRAAPTVALCLAAALCGCASSRTQTNRNVQYAGHPRRIFILESLIPLGDGFESTFERSIALASRLHAYRSTSRLAASTVALIFKSSRARACAAQNILSEPVGNYIKLRFMRVKTERTATVFA